MATLPVQRRQRTLFAEILEVEIKYGSYQLRAELPGVDPAKDVSIESMN